MKSFKLLWMTDQYERLRLDPDLKDISNKELQEYLSEIYSKRRISQGRFYNNVSNSNNLMTQEEFINYYMNHPLILSGYSCLLKNQDDCVNISSAALENLGEMRKMNKKKMSESEHGSNEYTYYRILQLTYKVLMNSYYGILGEKNSIFYNSFIQNSITMTGQDLITTSIIGMESFLTNNVPFEDTDDALTFINNVKKEKKSFSIMDYLDEGKSREDVVLYLLSNKKPDAVLDEATIRQIVSSLDIETLNRCYYKNRILDLILNNSWFQEKLKGLLQYEYAEEPDKKMVPALTEFREKIIDFCYYDYLYEDRYKRAMKDKRDSIIVVDTDSNFINLNNYIMRITKEFSLNKSDKKQQMMIMNIFVNIVTAVLKKVFWTLTTNMGLLDKAKPLINMKSEFVYKRIMLTRNKKSYAGIVTGELGNLLEYPVLDIKGLSIKKSTTASPLRSKFTDILQQDILEPENIDLRKIIAKYDDLEIMIEDSLRKGEVEYLLPKNLEVIESYKTPDSIEPVRGAIIWNALEPDNQIVPPEKVDLIKMDVTDANDPRLLALKESHPDKYDAIMKTVFNYGVSSPKLDISRFGFSCIAVPKGMASIPEYLIPMIDYKSMVSNNMSNGLILLESLGVWCEEVKTVKYKSNIISI